MKPITIKYCQYSNTIRQFPQNYLLVKREYNTGCWLVEPDSAANQQICIDLFKLVTFNHDLKYGDPQTIIEKYYNI